MGGSGAKPPRLFKKIHSKHRKIVSKNDPQKRSGFDRLTRWSSNSLRYPQIEGRDRLTRQRIRWSTTVSPLTSPGRWEICGKPETLMESEKHNTVLVKSHSYCPTVIRRRNLQICLVNTNPHLQSSKHILYNPPSPLFSKGGGGNLNQRSYFPDRDLIVLRACGGLDEVLSIT